MAFFSPALGSHSCCHSGDVLYTDPCRTPLPCLFSPDTRCLCACLSGAGHVSIFVSVYVSINVSICVYCTARTDERTTRGGTLKRWAMPKCWRAKSQSDLGRPVTTAIGYFAASFSRTCVFCTRQSAGRDALAQKLASSLAEAGMLYWHALLACSTGMLSPWSPLPRSRRP